MQIHDWFQTGWRFQQFLKKRKKMNKIALYLKKSDTVFYNPKTYHKTQISKLITNIFDEESDLEISPSDIEQIVQKTIRVVNSYKPYHGRQTINKLKNILKDYEDEFGGNSSKIAEKLFAELVKQSFIND